MARSAAGSRCYEVCEADRLGGCTGRKSLPLREEGIPTFTEVRRVLESIIQKWNEMKIIINLKELKREKRKMLGKNKQKINLNYPNTAIYVHY